VVTRGGTPPSGRRCRGGGRALAADLPAGVEVHRAILRQAAVPQLQMRADREAMAQYGVTPGALAAAVLGSGLTT